MRVKNLNEIKIMNDINLDNLWHLNSINVDNAWQYTKGEDISITIIDTGVFHHNDLDIDADNCRDYIKDGSGYNDISGHGTLIAGLIKGLNTGVAPKSNIYVSKSLNKDGLGSYRSVVDGITYAINMGSDIICMSLGAGSKLPYAIESELKRAKDNGIITVAASGNRGNHQINYPAFYDYVIGVGGTNEDGNRADFSNYGKNLDVVAPSSNIISTHLYNGYAISSGTSLASAITVGSIALMKSYLKNYKGKDVDIYDIRKILSKSSLDDGGNSHRYGYGKIDLKRIFNYLKH